MGYKNIAEFIDPLKIAIQNLERRISQLEANTDVSSTCPLPLPTPDSKNAPETL